MDDPSRQSILIGKTRRLKVGQLVRTSPGGGIGVVTRIDPPGSGVWVQWPDRDRPYLHNRRFLTRVSRTPGQLCFEGWTVES